MDYGGISTKFVNYMNRPVLVFGMSPAQFIEKEPRQEVDKNFAGLVDFLMPPPGLIALLAAGGLLYWLSLALFLHLKKPSLPSRRRWIIIVSFFYVLFLFFVGQFFSGNLNTENIVVQTDDLIYSKEQILQTQKTFCFFEKSNEIDFFKDVSSSLKIFKMESLLKIFVI